MTLRDVLAGAMEQLRLRAGGTGFSIEDLDQLITREGPAEVRAVVGSGFDIAGSTRQGTVADVPWISVFPTGAGASAQRGYYVVFLFAKDGTRAYLSLNQGTEDVRGGTGALRKRVLDIRSVLGDAPDLGADLDLRSTNARPRKYEAGSAYAIEYPSPLGSAEETLHRDLRRMTALLEQLTSTGLEFDPQFEPQHMLFKWNKERNERTIEDHKAIAESEGSVWWGRFAQPGGRSVSETKAGDLDRQIAAGIPTYAFLYRRGEAWRTRVQEVSADSVAVRDDPRLPSYYTADECNFFVRLADFEPLDPDWASTHLLLVSDPDPAKVPGALSNQTTPLFVYERFDPAVPASRPVVTTSSVDVEVDGDREELTVEWLLEETLLTSDLLDEVLEALRGRFPQVAFAGPPGTGKSYLAELLARYLTQDEPLAYRVVQFHPSYTYEEFVEGLRPVSRSGAISFERTDGKVLEMARAGGDEAARVLVLDEMNRANLPRVFGELMYLFEKRDQSIDLLYSKDFSLPKRLYFIGTLNTADRSIRSIDIALRRRFAIFELSPSAEVLDRFYERSGRTNDLPDLLDGFVRLNETLTAALDRHHTVGHTFFMADHYTPELLRTVWRRQLRPLLEEYFFDQPEIAADYTLATYWPSAADAS